MHANQFWWHYVSSFGDFAPFQIWPNFPFGTWTIVYYTVHYIYAVSSLAFCHSSPSPFPPPLSLFSLYIVWRHCLPQWTVLSHSCLTSQPLTVTPSLDTYRNGRTSTSTSSSPSSPSSPPSWTGTPPSETTPSLILAVVSAAVILVAGVGR